MQLCLARLSDLILCWVFKMAVKGVANVNRNLKKFLANVQDVRTPQALLVIAQTGIGISQLYVPVATDNLINSKFYELFGKSSAIAGYKRGFSGEKEGGSGAGTGFNYGLYLHENTQWKPVSKKNATHHFLSDAFENPAYQQDYLDIVKEQYKL